MAWKWYGVRTVYRSEAIEKPQGTDRVYSADVSLVEDRVVLVRARNLDEAIRKGEKEARSYASESPHRNPYGQSVKCRYLGCCDAFELWENPDQGEEVFSSTEVVARRETDKAVIQRVIGSRQTARTKRQRQNFVDIVFSKPAKGVVVTEDEIRFRKKIEKRLSGA